ncbi:MAG: hypothetical protein R3C18_20300 [Planctomycetaceae bacterium]
MSHHQLFMSWRKGVPQPIPIELLLDILKRHGGQVSVPDETHLYVAFPAVDGDTRIGDDGLVTFNEEGAFEFGIDRPRYQPEFYALALDLIQTLDLCMLISSGEEAFVSHQDRIADLPAPLVEVAHVVETMDDFSKG